MVHHNSPIVLYIREVLDEHTLPLPGNNPDALEAIWLIEMLRKTEAIYKQNGIL